MLVLWFSSRCTSGFQSFSMKWLHIRWNVSELREDPGILWGFYFESFSEGGRVCALGIYMHLRRRGTSGERVRSQFETIGLARTQQTLILCHKQDSDWSAPWHFTVVLHTSLAGETWQERFIDWKWSATAELAQEQGWISLRTCAAFHRDHRVYLHLHRRDGLWGCGGRRAMALSSEYEWLGGGRHRFDSWCPSVLYELRWLCSPDVFLLTLFHHSIESVISFSCSWKWVEKSQSTTSVL